MCVNILLCVRTLSLPLRLGSNFAFNSFVFLLIGSFNDGITNGQFLTKQEESSYKIPLGTIANAKRYSAKNGGTMIDGQLVIASDKLIQRVSGQGTSYFLMENSNGKPLYKRKELDTNKQVILFPDPTFPPGDGHYVVLNRLHTRGISPMREPVYQGFYLVLGDSLHSYMSVWKATPREEKKAKETPMGKRLEEMKKKKQRMEKQMTYNVEFSEVDFSDMVKRIKRQDINRLNMPTNTKSNHSLDGES